MTNNADDVFDDDDPFQNLEERLSDALDSAAQPEPDTSEEPESPNDAELRLVMERIRTRSETRRSPEVEAVPNPPEDTPAPFRDLPTTRNFAGSHDSSDETNSIDDDVTTGDLIGAEPNHVDSSGIDSTDIEIIRGRTRHRSDDRDSGAYVEDPGAAEHFTGEDPDLADLLDDEPVIPEWSFAIASAEQDSLELADQAIDLSDLPDFLSDHDEDPELLAEPPAPDRSDFDQPRSSTFGSRVIDLGAATGRGGGAIAGVSSGSARQNSPSSPPDARRMVHEGGNIPRPLPTEPPHAPRPTQLPPSGVAASQPPPMATAVQPVVAVGHTPGKQASAPAPSAPLRSEPQGPMTTTLVIPREPIQERKSNSRGLLFTAGGITLIVLSVLVYANYFLGNGPDTPTKNMDPALEETPPSAQDTSTTTTTTSAAAPTPEVKLTACDSEAAHVTITTQSATPIIAMIRFQFLKDGEIYYEEESETPAITAGEPLTKSLLLVGKELPPEYVGVEPDDCKVQVIGVASA